MVDLNPIRCTIIDILEFKQTKDWKYVVILKEHLELLEELLGKSLNPTTSDIPNISSFLRINLQTLSQKDILILKEYLEYINMIEE